VSSIAHASQVDLGFGNSTRELLNFSARGGPGNFARERFNLFGQFGIGTNGKAERVAKRVSRRASAANSGLRASASPGIYAVCPNLLRTSHAVLLPSIDFGRRLRIRLPQFAPRLVEAC